MRSRKKDLKIEGVDITEKRFPKPGIKNELKQDFKRISDSPEMIEMAEWGLKDYAKQLKEWDK